MARVSRWLARILLAIVVVVTATLATHGSYVWARFGTPQWEDARFFAHVAEMRGVEDAMTRGSAWEGLYRPLSTNVYYLLGAHLFDHSLRVYHSLNITLFCINGLLAYLIARFFVRDAAALFCAACFASRQASSEILIYTVQMQTVLPAFFSLAALLAWLVAVRRDYALPPAIVGTSFVGLALLAKEASVGMFAILTVASMVHPHKPIVGGRLGRWGRRFVIVLPAVITAVWFSWARRYLAVERNQYWTYESDGMSVMGNYVAYAISFWNGSVSPFILHDPCVLLRDFPIVVAARESHVLRGACCVAAIGLAIGLGRLMLMGRPRGTSQRRDAGAALGLTIFFVALAPVVVMHDRLLCYYAYLGHFGISLFGACVCERLFAEGRRSGGIRGILRS